MIDIVNCELEGQISGTPIFEIKGIYFDDDFHCKVELRFDTPQEETSDYEYIDGIDLGPEGLDILEELLDAIFETETYQETFENFQKIAYESGNLFD